MSDAPRRPTGAWLPGDPVGHRRFETVISGRPFHLEGGAVLSEVTLAYETWGVLDDQASNAVLVCPALTGDSHASGRAGNGHAAPGWWEGLIGPGRAIDTDRYYVVCVNVLGGCQGSTGPASIDPGSGRPYGSSFPVVTIRDIVRTQAMLATRIGVHRWRSVIGGSMGGMQVLEWAVMFPDRVGSFVAIATSMAASAQQIAWSMVGRRAIQQDPSFHGGDYYDADDGGPRRGLALARQIAQIHYRSEEVFDARFGRKLVDPRDAFGTFSLDQRFDVEGYLDYHGTKLVNRFDANSYLRLNKAMDLHDLARGRGSLRQAIDRITAPSLVMSIRSDALYPPYQQEAFRDALLAAGRRVGFYDIDSDDGHDGFLLEAKQISPLVAAYLDSIDDLHDLESAPR